MATLQQGDVGQQLRAEGDGGDQPGTAQVIVPSRPEPRVTASGGTPTPANGQLEDSHARLGITESV